MKAIAVFRDGLVVAPGFFFRAPLLFPDPLFRVGRQLADGLSLLAGLQGPGEQAFELLQGGALVQHLRTAVAGPNYEQPILVDPPSEFFPDPLFFCVGKRLGVVDVEQELHFGFHLIDVLAAAAGTSHGPVPQFFF